MQTDRRSLRRTDDPAKYLSRESSSSAVAVLIESIAVRRFWAETRQIAIIKVADGTNNYVESSRSSQLPLAARDLSGATTNFSIVRNRI